MVQDFLVFLAQALRVTSERLNAVTPIPWPLWVFALLPVYAVGLSAFIWWMRGSVWPLLCGYPVTTTRYPCRNRVIGEWRRCHVHRRQRQRRSDGHEIVPGLRRWQTVTPGGLVQDQQGQAGRGLVRLESSASTLLYRLGYARRPQDVVRFLPAWWRETQGRWVEARRRWDALREAPQHWRTVLWPGRPVVGVVAERLPVVILATRASLYCVATGLSLVILAVLLPPAAEQYVDYAAACGFVGAWALLKEGVWLAEDRWWQLAWRDAWHWALPVLLFSVVGGSILATVG